MPMIKESGLEIVPGIMIPWGLFDGFICGLIEKGDVGILTDIAVDKVDDVLEKVVNKTTFKFDNVGKVKLLKALTTSMVKKYRPELLP